MRRARMLLLRCRKPREAAALSANRLDGSPQSRRPRYRDEGNGLAGKPELPGAASLNSSHPRSVGAKL